MGRPKKRFDTEILCVGTELLLGHVTNTNARDVSEMLSEIGVNVRYHTVVGDNPQRLADCVRIARERADILITTGGLGPTCDDLTKQVICRCFGVPLVESAEEIETLNSFIRSGRQITQNNFAQALVPEGGTVFHNLWGTAPGCAFEKDGKLVIMLPGPPVECVPMFRHCVMPFLQKRSRERIVSHAVRIFGLGESAVDELFAEEMNAMQNPSMAPYAKECDCLLQITAKAPSRRKAEEMIAPVLKHVKEVLGDYVFGMDVESIEEAVLPMLAERELHLAVAESCTGGEIGKRITDIPGASAVYLGGAVTYSDESKHNLLGIDRSIIRDNGAVSRIVAECMAAGMRALSGAELSIAVTGLAGPDGDGVHPVGTVFVALDAMGDIYVRELSMGAHRTRSFIRRMAGNHAFDMIRRWLLGLEICPDNLFSLRSDYF